LVPFRKDCVDIPRRRGSIRVLTTPYSPDFNPIKEHFGVLKKFIKKKWYKNEDFIIREFKMFLEWCVNVVGNNADIAEYYFHYTGISIT
jgi:transposase